MPNMLSPRLTRIAIALTSHNYEITYKPGPQIGCADSLSRWPQPVPEQPEQPLCDILLMAETPEDFPYDAEHIASATKQDRTLCQVVHYIQRGWPAKVNDVNLRPFWLHRAELSLQNDCILLGCRVVVPRELRKQVLKVLHKTHTGIVQTKAVARSYIWWPGLNEDIELLIGSCTQCLENRHMPPKTSHEWITPTRPWSRIHLDFAGPFHSKYFLIMVDAYSRWPELFVVNNTTSATVIRLLRSAFSTHGLCEIVVTDNATSFVSNEMQKFLKANNIKHVTTAPYHPATNGLAERMVQTIKDKLKKMNNLAWDVKIPNLLLALRNTPCTTTNKTPAELLMKRRLRTLLDTIHPDCLQAKRIEEQIINNSEKKTRETNPGQQIMYRNYSNTGPRWLPGIISKKTGPLSYKIETNDGKIINGHIDQIIRKTSATTQTDEEGHNMEGVNEGREETIITVPDESEWATMLGIPVTAESGGITE